MDLVIRKLADKIIKDLNESQIPIEVKRYILKDIYLQVEAKAEEIIREEARKADKKAEEQKKGDSE